MKQIFTLLSLAVLCLFTNQTTAQVTQAFDAANSSSPLPGLTANCWSFNGTSWTNNPTLNGTGSLVVIPTTSSSTNTTSNNGKITTPFIAFKTGNVISLKYKLSNRLATQATRIITFSLQDRNGTITTLASITLDNNTDHTSILTFSYALTAANAGIQRLVIDISGSGDGNSYLYMDDLSVVKGASFNNSTIPAFQYSPNNCNSAPTANNDTYYATAAGSYTGTSVLSNDSDPNTAETLTASIVTQSPDGTVVLNPNGTFTFTPNAGFTRSFTTFTYRATDNGYEVLGTDAIVTIYFPITTLPLTLVQFSGTLTGGKATLNWSVAENESGNYFELQKSTAGKVFESAGLFFATATAGTEQYAYTDAAILADVMYYRLKLVDKNGRIQFSNIVVLRTKSAPTPAALSLLQNPVQQTVNASYLSASTEAAQLTVYNTMGVRLHSSKVMLQKGANKLSVNLTGSYPTGNYILEVRSGSGSSTTQFIKH
jgi:hypothetical protein